MPLSGEREIAFVDPEHGSTLDWSAVNLVVSDLANEGQASVLRLEDDQGNIKTPLSPYELSVLYEHLATHGEAISKKYSMQDLCERVKTFSGQRESVIFVMSAIRWFKERISDSKHVIVQEMPADKIEITPQ